MRRHLVYRLQTKPDWQDHPTIVLVNAPPPHAVFASIGDREKYFGPHVEGARFLASDTRPHVVRTAAALMGFLGRRSGRR